MGLDPHIMLIESFNKEDSSALMIKGCYFYRPNETYHLATRKFLEKVKLFLFVSILMPVSFHFYQKSKNKASVLSPIKIQ
jgi:phage replication-related protein YjqB (UPF0714/DUF867 family)